MEEVVLATLESLVEAIENGEEPPTFQQGEQDTLLILGSNSGIGGREGKVAEEVEVQTNQQTQS